MKIGSKLKSRKMRKKIIIGEEILSQKIDMEKKFKTTISHEKFENKKN